MNVKTVNQSTKAVEMWNGELWFDVYLEMHSVWGAFPERHIAGEHQDSAAQGKDLGEIQISINFSYKRWDFEWGRQLERFNQWTGEEKK